MIMSKVQWVMGEARLTVWFLMCLLRGSYLVRSYPHTRPREPDGAVCRTAAQREAVSAQRGTGTVMQPQRDRPPGHQRCALEGWESGHTYVRVTSTVQLGACILLPVIHTITTAASQLHSTTDGLTDTPHR